MQNMGRWALLLRYDDASGEIIAQELHHFLQQSSKEEANVNQTDKKISY
jgi:hypothetical protein